MNTSFAKNFLISQPILIKFAVNLLAWKSQSFQTHLPLMCVSPCYMYVPSLKCLLVLQPLEKVSMI